MNLKRHLYYKELQKVEDEIHSLVKRNDEDEAVKLETRKRLDELYDLRMFYETSLIMTVALNMGLSECFDVQMKNSYNVDGRIVLTPMGQTLINRMIRDERMKRIEQWMRIIGPILSSLIALAGVLVALVAILIKG